MDTNETVVNEGFDDVTGSPTEAPIYEGAEQDASGEVEADQTADGDDENTTVDEAVEFPKKAVNALKRRNKQINKLNSENAYLKQEIDQIKSMLQNGVRKETPAPKIDDFETIEEYTQAQANHATARALEAYKKELAEANTPRAPSPHEVQIQERIAAIDVDTQKFAQTHPDIDDLYDANEDIVESWSPDLKMLFIHADNPVQAFYNLAKSGEIESLGSLPPQYAAMKIAQASAKQVAPPKRVSNTPKPLGGLNGSSAHTKSLNDLDPAALMERLSKLARNS